MFEEEDKQREAEKESFYHSDRFRLLYGDKQGNDQSTSDLQYSLRNDINIKCKLSICFRHSPSQSLWLSVQPTKLQMVYHSSSPYIFNSCTFQNENLKVWWYCWDEWITAHFAHLTKHLQTNGFWVFISPWIKCKKNKENQWKLWIK